MLRNLYFLVFPSAHSSIIDAHVLWTFLICKAFYLYFYFIIIATSLVCVVCRWGSRLRVWGGLPQTINRTGFLKKKKILHSSFYATYTSGEPLLFRFHYVPLQFLQSSSFILGLLSCVFLDIKYNSYKAAALSQLKFCCHLQHFHSNTWGNWWLFQWW